MYTRISYIYFSCILANLHLIICFFFQKYAMQQAMKTLMGQMDSQNNQFGNAAFSPGSPFPFPPPHHHHHHKHHQVQLPRHLLMRLNVQ